MKLSITDTQQHDMRHAWFDGAPGILVSGLVWIIAAVVCLQVGMHQSVWTLLIGGALIHPLGLLLTKALGRPARVGEGNALEQLAMASTVWLILCCALAYGLYLLDGRLFFPAMLATIGCRYLVFATVFGRPVFWVLGGVLIVAANLGFFAALPPALVAGLGGVIEVGFAGWVFRTASRAGAEAR
jgi:hypothetical protein